MILQTVLLPRPKICNRIEYKATKEGEKENERILVQSGEIVVNRWHTRINLSLRCLTQSFVNIHIRNSFLSFLQG